MDNLKNEDCKITIQLNGSKIYEAGWCYTAMSSNIQEVEMICNLLDQHKSFMFGFLKGLKTRDKFDSK